MEKLDIKKQNEQAWDQKVTDHIDWTIPVSSEVIDRARKNKIDVSLCWKKTVPRQWFPDRLSGVKILCLACGGGQQGPVLAAAGADVTVMDISARQLQQDRIVAEREALSLNVVQGDMCNLSIFGHEQFDMVFCLVSITYIADLTLLYEEVHRVLIDKGVFMLGAPNPAIYLFDAEKWSQGIYQVANRLPFNSLDELNECQKKAFIADNKAIEFSHTLETIIGGQLSAGFVIDQFFEESSGKDVGRYFKDYFATRAIKVKL